MRQNYSKILFIAFLFFLMNASLFAAATRHVNTDDCRNQITIQTDFLSQKGGYAIIESLPQGLLPSNISQNGIWHAESHTIKWGAQDNMKVEREFTLEVTQKLQWTPLHWTCK